jgi:ABC-type multidrug transport system fused ATPase/permease subunit
MNLNLLSAAFLSASISFVAPMSSLAQTQELSVQEQSAVSTLNRILTEKNNRLVRMINDRGKADDLQNICLRLDTGTTLEDLDKKVVERTLQMSDQNMAKQVLGYYAFAQVVAIRQLCPRHRTQLEESLKNP